MGVGSKSPDVIILDDEEPTIVQPRIGQPVIRPPVQRALAPATIQSQMRPILPPGMQIMPGTHRIALPPMQGMPSYQVVQQIGGQTVTRPITLVGMHSSRI